MELQNTVECMRARMHIRNGVKLCHRRADEMHVARSQRRRSSCRYRDALAIANISSTPLSCFLLSDPFLPLPALPFVDMYLLFVPVVASCTSRSKVSAPFRPELDLLALLQRMHDVDLGCVHICSALSQIALSQDLSTYEMVQRRSNVGSSRLFDCADARMIASASEQGDGH